MGRKWGGGVYGGSYGGSAKIFLTWKGVYKYGGGGLYENFLTVGGGSTKYSSKKGGGLGKNPIFDNFDPLR